ncbi:hypothetical protein Q5424_06360 [Conexibacter sp. JD483]|uniref:hypothetical protein n=1 Tax=unclassified Conexibacter TaxID=2627773 RepID=UPI002716289E|nr:MULTISPECIES: hypothetical protein [unclassified Conexibacter]MDO8184820.1 hypothetical protein [Conexibacter sp. CPCC 205706]MDO8196595.1 hypothetical protein [Conexibacter sp. CPCC 205762]MDR9368692.1 hypothetical protein [Conexibacter sp. JD483]
MPRLEQIAYDAGRHALADQEAQVAGIRQRAGTLLAAHALVASFLGAGALREAGATPLAWFALAALGGGLLVAALLLAPWRMRFSLTLEEVHTAATSARWRTVYDPSDWLMAVALAYENACACNKQMVSWMTRLSTTFAVLVVVHAALWIAVLVGVE